MSNTALKSRLIWQFSSPTLLPLYLVVLAGTLVHLPFVVPQAIWLWNSQHYSFFPLIFVAAGWLSWNRLQSGSIVFSERLSGGVALLLGINLAVLGLATVSNSRWLGWISFLLFLWTSARLLLDRRTSSRIWAPLLILLLTIPFPLGLDSALVIQLQKLATSQGSLMLDYYGLRHAVSGVAVRLPGRVFLIDEACSGIHSLFSAFATMTFFCVFCRYGFWRTVLNLSQTVFWVLVANSIRVFVVVFGSVRWNTEIDRGWRHDIVGFAFYMFIILTALSTDQFLRYLFPPRVQDYGFKINPRPRFQWMVALTALMDKPFQSKVSSALATVGLCLFLIIGTAMGVQASQARRQAAPARFTDELAFELQEDELPEIINGWKRTKFERVKRQSADLLGATSFIWTYENNGFSVQFSVDGAYPDFHDLWYCYSATDWKLRRSENIILPGGVGPSGGHEPATELQLYRGDTEQAYVVFTCADAVGQVVQPPESAGTFSRKLFDRLRAGSLLRNNDASNFVPPVLQFQVFCHGNTEILPDERTEVQSLFAELRQVAGRRIWRTSAPPTNG